MGPLIFSAALLWFGIAYRLFYIRRGTNLAVRELVSAYRRKLPSKTKGFLTKAAKKALKVQQWEPADLRVALEDKLFLQVEGLSRFRTLVRSIVIVAPLLGLLGTVNGMIEMFDSLADQNFYSQSGGVAQGISQALFTTQFGLVIAIPGLLVGGIIDRRERRIKDDIVQVKEILIAEEEA